MGDETMGKVGKVDYAKQRQSVSQLGGEGQGQRLLWVIGSHSFISFGR